jgi:hypothetical protein
MLYKSKGNDCYDYLLRWKMLRTVFGKWVPPQGKELDVSLWKWWTQERLRRYVRRTESYTPS